MKFVEFENLNFHFSVFVFPLPATTPTTTSTHHLQPPSLPVAISDRRPPSPATSPVILRPPPIRRLSLHPHLRSLPPSQFHHPRGPNRPPHPPPPRRRQLPSSFNALTAYDLRSPLHPRLFLTPLHNPTTSTPPPNANNVAIDFSGNAYVTNSANNLIWKITPDNTPSVFSTSPAFTAHPIETDKIYSFCGLNGIVYNGKGYLLVVQSNTGKMFKVNEQDGTARTVLLIRYSGVGSGLEEEDEEALRGLNWVVIILFLLCFFF